MMKLMAAKRWALAERSLYTKRYIDDIGNFNNNKFADRRYQRASGAASVLDKLDVSVANARVSSTRRRV